MSDETRALEGELARAKRRELDILIEKLEDIEVILSDAIDQLYDIEQEVEGDKRKAADVRDIRLDVDSSIVEIHKVLRYWDEEAGF